MSSWADQPCKPIRPQSTCDESTWATNILPQMVIGYPKPVLPITGDNQWQGRIMTTDHVNSAELDHFNFFSREVPCDMYPVLARLRAERPVANFHQPGFQRAQYVVTTRALVQEVFRDHKHFASHFMDALNGGGKGDPEVRKILATTVRSRHAVNGR